MGENPRQPSGRMSTEFERELEDSRITKKCGVYRFRVPPRAQKQVKSKNK